MKICLFTDCFLPGIGGGEIVVHNLAKTFTELGHFVVVVTYNRKGLSNYRLPYKVKGIPPLFYRLGLKTFIEKRAICYYQKKYEFDVISVHKTYVGYSVGKVKAKLNTPVTITAHGGDVQKDAKLGYGKRFSEPKWEGKIAYAVKQADALVAISADSERCFKELGARQGQIYRIANGVNIERFAQDHKLDRKSLGLKENDKIILAVGRYHIKKGYETLIRSMSLVEKKLENVKLLIVGRQSKKLYELITELGLEDKVLLIKEQKGTQVDDCPIFPNDFLLSLYKNAEVFVSSSIIEGFALVCIEAMAAGLPMVLTKCPGNEDVFEEDGKGGYYVPVGDEVAMSDRLTDLLQNAEKRKMFSKYNVSYSQKYSMVEIANKYLELFRLTIGTKENE